MGILNLVHQEYAHSIPEIYKMLVAVLRDYNPNLGNLHREKVSKWQEFGMVNYRNQKQKTATKKWAYLFKYISLFYLILLYMEE